jgi:hypothetical protein
VVTAAGVFKPLKRKTNDPNFYYFNRPGHASSAANPGSFATPGEIANRKTK